MKLLQLALLALCASLAATLSACSSFSVSSNFDPAVDFSRGFHSYAWLPDAEMTDTGVHDPLTDKLLREAIDAEMAERGFVKASGAPEFFVAYQAGIESKIGSRPSSGGGVAFGSGGYHGVALGVSSNSEVYQYDEGTLILDFLSGEKHELAWRGTVSRAVNKDESRDARVASVRSAVRKMLEQFPPKKT